MLFVINFFTVTHSVIMTCSLLWRWSWWTTLYISNVWKGALIGGGRSWCMSVISSTDMTSSLQLSSSCSITNFSTNYSCSQCLKTSTIWKWKIYKEVSRYTHCVFAVANLLSFLTVSRWKACPWCRSCLPTSWVVYSHSLISLLSRSR